MVLNNGKPADFAGSESIKWSCKNISSRVKGQKFLCKFFTSNAIYGEYTACV